MNSARARLVLLALSAALSLACHEDALEAADDVFDLDCPGVTAHVTNVDTFLVVGHRGAAGKAVENTLDSLSVALADGANAIEIDLSLTSDGQVVLWHDWDPDSEIALARQEGLEGGSYARPSVPDVGDDFRRAVSDLTLDELRAHYGYRTRDGDEPLDAHVPTFAEVVAWAVTQPALSHVFLDVKAPEDQPDLAAALVASANATLASAGAGFTAVYLTPYDSVWQRLSPLTGKGLSYDVDPGVVVVADQDCSDSSSTKAIARGGGYATTVRPGGFAEQDWKALKTLVGCDLDARDQSTASGERLVEKVLAATIDDQDKMECLIDFGVDGLLSDDPALLRSVSDARLAQIR